VCVCVCVCKPKEKKGCKKNQTCGASELGDFMQKKKTEDNT
jgi:hypothetical protein